MKAGDVVIGMLHGAVETKVRPAVVIASGAYLVERPDVLVGILTSKPPRRMKRASPYSWAYNAG